MARHTLPVNSFVRPTSEGPMSATAALRAGIAALLFGVLLCGPGGDRALTSIAAEAFQGSAAEDRRKVFDEILDLNVRDGMVYYRALKGQRSHLDSYIGSLSAVPIDRASREEQVAFWINAYNAL